MDAMGAATYVYLVQKETYADNIERALRLNEYDWDVDEFIYHEKQVEGAYSYLDKFYDDDFENLAKYYEACIQFMT